MGHVLRMTAAGTVGLMAIFLVDFADMYFLSLLGEVEVAAAIGYAGSILFFTTSVGIGLAIAASALVARSIGAGTEERSRRLSVHAHLYAILVAGVLAAVTWALVPRLLEVLGAEGRAHALAQSYLRIIVPSMPLLALGICASGVLRAAGDARSAMLVTLSSAAVNAILDPVFIFALGLGVDGAAWASVAARLAALAVGFHGVAIRHGLIAAPTLAGFLEDIPAISKIASLAILTNIATPFANAYVTGAIAAFGDGPVAGWAVVGRLVPVAFGGVFALSGAVGPILGQNLGAERYARLREILSNALVVIVVYVLVVWLVLAIGSEQIAGAFSASGEARAVIVAFCRWLAPLFVFFGALFVANAAFNNLGAPHYSTLFNWSRATLGTIPLVSLGAELFGAAGVIAGNLFGAMIFGSAAVITCYRFIDAIEKGRKAPASRWPGMARRMLGWPFNIWRSR